MSLDFDRRLAELGIALPIPPDPLYNYVPVRRVGEMLYVAGQLHLENGMLRQQGQLGADATLATAKEAARVCGMNILAQVRKGCGGTLNRVIECVRLTGYVNSAPGCTDQAGAMDGCSDLMVDVLGEAGRHVRTVVGVSSLPRNGIVVVEATFHVIVGSAAQVSNQQGLVIQ